VFFLFFYDSWGCLVEIFAGFLGFLLGFLEGFIGNLQRDLCLLFGLDFCCFFVLGFY